MEVRGKSAGKELKAFQNASDTFEVDLVKGADQLQIKKGRKEVFVQSNPKENDAYIYIYIYIYIGLIRSRFFFKLRNYIVNWNTMTRKSSEHLRTTYGNTGRLFRSYLVSSAMYTVISTTGDRTSDHRLKSLGKGMNSLQLCVNSRADWILQPWWGN